MRRLQPLRARLLGFALLGAVAASLGCAGQAPTQPPPPDAQPPITQPPSLATCDGNCAVLTAAASNADLELPFEQAFFGVTQGDGADTLYLELYRGGDDGCPTVTSATPAQTLIIANLPVFTDRDELDEADGVTSTLLDFAGDLTEVLAPGSATTLTISPRAISHVSPRFVAFDLDGAYEHGLAASGHVYATHCPSLDATR